MNSGINNQCIKSYNDFIESENIESLGDCIKFFDDITGYTKQIQVYPNRLHERK